MSPIIKRESGIEAKDIQVIRRFQVPVAEEGRQARSPELTAQSPRGFSFLGTDRDGNDDSASPNDGSFVIIADNRYFFSHAWQHVGDWNGMVLNKFY